MLGGLDSPTSGSVSVEDKSIEKMSGEQLTVFRRQRIGFIFQNYNLIPYLTAYENIVLPVRLDGRTEDVKFLEDIVQFLELEGKLKNYPGHLSGGQQQRVAIARALISKPAIILADVKWSMVLIVYCVHSVQKKRKKGTLYTNRT